MKLKNAYDPTAPTKNLVSTIAGVITLILTVLVATGVISPAISTDLSHFATLIIDAVVVIIGSISGIISIFKAKDA